MNYCTCTGILYGLTGITPSPGQEPMTRKSQLLPAPENHLLTFKIEVSIVFRVRN